jgi:hypothetical protein
VKTLSSNPILSGGTANGVAYLNGSKVLTTGTALTFDGTKTAEVSSAATDYTGLILNNTSASGKRYNLASAGSGSYFDIPTGAFGIRDLTAGATRLILDTSGNLGLGGTPSAWHPTYKALQITNYGTNLYGYSGGGGITGLSHNAYYDGTNWKYQVGTFNAARYVMDGTGVHTWLTSGPGAAGSNVTFYQSMTLSTSSTLSVLGNFTCGQLLATLPDVGLNIYSGSDSGSYGRIRHFQGTAGTNYSNIHFFSSNWNGAGFEAKSQGAINIAGYTGVTFGGWDSPDASINSIRMRLNGDRYLLCGPNSGWSRFLQVGGNSRYDSGWASIITTDGNLHMDPKSGNEMYLNYYSGNAVGVYNGASNGGFGTIKAAAFTVSSDYRLKENIVSIADGALASVLALSPKEYDLAGYDTRRFYGFLAHELADHFPIAVVGEKDAVKEDGAPNYQGVEYMQLVPVLVKAIQEQQAIIEQLKADVQALKEAA